MSSDDPPDDFALFAAGCAGRLLHAADLLAGDRARAEDLVQGALAKAYARWPSIRDGHPEVHVRRIMLNAYLDWWRRLRWREVAPREHDPAPHAEDPAAGVARRDAVQRALASLTRRERAVVVLRYWCDLSEAQIAAELGIAPGTVKSTSARALARLRTSEHLIDPLPTTSPGAV